MTAAVAVGAAAVAAGGSAGGAVGAGGILHAASGAGAWTSQVGGHNHHPPAVYPPGVGSPLGWGCGVGEQHPLMKGPAAAGGTCSSCGWRAACHQGEKRNLKEEGGEGE